MVKDSKDLDPIDTEYPDDDDPDTWSEEAYDLREIDGHLTHVRLTERELKERTLRMQNKG
jgi:hypothetical protein